MPVVLLERIPVPSLHTYTALSVVLLSCAIFYAYQTVVGVGELVKPQYQETDVKNEAINSSSSNDEGVTVVPMDEDMTFNITLPYENFALNVMYVLSTEVWCVWTLVNTAYCCLILLGKVIQRLVFGSLRVMETQHLKDKFWNFLFYKFIFIFGVMNVQSMDEVVLWVTWFTVLGFLHLLTQLSKDRFEYLSFSPATPHVMHGKLLTLLSILLCLSGCLLIISVLVGLEAGITIFAFMAAECLLLGVRVLYVLVRYVIHLLDLNTPSVWENRATYMYYTELTFELAVLSVDFGHHLHMLLWGNIFLSMASLIICMQLRYLFYEFQRRIKRHKNYRRVVQNMEARFSMASKEDIQQNNDNCAVCWEKMDSARKLPCGHLFHNACLRSWLEQDTSCPTCRTSLNEGQPQDPNDNLPNEQGDAPNAIPGGIPPLPANNQAMTNHFFHFDGSRYVSWLPSFSVEVTHTQLMPGQRQTPMQTSQLDSMARQVQSVFPNLPLSVITEDIRITRSVDFTIENILEGRIQVPPPGTIGTRTAAEDLGDNNDNAEGIQPPQELEMLLPSVVSLTSASAIQHNLQQHYHNDLQFSHDNLQMNVPEDHSDAVDNLQVTEENRPLEHMPTGGRFSKSASERQSMLQQRKSSMLEQARRSFLSRSEVNVSGNMVTNPQPGSYNASGVQHVLNSQSGEESLTRREFAFQTAQRRIHRTDQ